MLNSTETERPVEKAVIIVAVTINVICCMSFEISDGHIHIDSPHPPNRSKSTSKAVGAHRFEEMCRSIRTVTQRRKC
jgi:hypothetical protein